MESRLDSSSDGSGSPGPLLAPPLDEECPDDQPLRDSRFTHDQRELGPVSSPPLDLKSSGGPPEENPMFADDNREIVATPASSNSNDQHKSTDDNFLNKFDVNHFHTINSHIQHERFDELLKLIDIDGQRQKPVSLMNDPVLNVVIFANKTQLVVKLIEKVKSIRPLWEKNIYGDIALHTAVVEGNITVTEALLKRESLLVKAMNKKGETAVHKAVMYGHGYMFWYLVNIGGLLSPMYVEN